MNKYHPNGFDWSDDKVAKLKELAGICATASIVTVEFNYATGSSLTRSAVIGKLHRLGVPFGSASAKRRVASSRAGRIKKGKKDALADTIHSLNDEGLPRRQIVSLAGVRYREVAKVLGPVTDEEMRAKRARPHLRDLPRRKVSAWMEGGPVEITAGATADSRLVGIMDLKETSCRWPIGEPADPDFRYCGATKVEGHSYCRPHCAAGYQPPAARTKITTWIDGPRRRPADRSGAGRVFA